MMMTVLSKFIREIDNRNTAPAGAQNSDEQIIDVLKRLKVARNVLPFGFGPVSVYLLFAFVIPLLGYIIVAIYLLALGCIVTVWFAFTAPNQRRSLFRIRNRAEATSTNQRQVLVGGEQ
jgi:hypothetical protein